jgi:hypothetical protein
MNGHWDVTETKEFLEHSYGPGRGALKDYLVYPIPRLYCFENKPDVHRKVRCSFIIKAHEGHERRYL